MGAWAWASPGETQPGLGDDGQWWPEGEQRKREKSLRESNGRGRNLRERDVGDRHEREKKNWFYNSAIVWFYL